MVDLSGIPNDFGCYLFKNSDGVVIYVGKAKDLSKRVKSYFSKRHEDSKTRALVSHIVDVDFVVTDSEVEALILENNLIKKYKPKYNIDLKDSKRYAYIEVTREEFPRLLVARSRSAVDESGRKRGRLYGPFVSGMSRDYVLRMLQRVFMIRTCKKLPRKICMRYSIGLCSGPCEKKISKSDYLRDVKSAEMVLKGKTSELVKSLSFRMKEFSGRQDYERALEVRNQIKAVKEMGERQKMERQKSYDEDIINWKIWKDVVYLTLFNSRKGILENKQDFEFAYSDNFLEEFLVQFYSDNEVPREIVLPGNVGGDLKEFLKGYGGKVVIPKRGEKKELLDLVMKNIEIALFGDSEKLEDLRDKLKLNDLPKVIECFDISHLSGTSTVASMVQFRSAKPSKENYRRYKIRSVEGIDDFACMQEVVRRRYTKLRDEKLAMPDLILIDGGKGQLSSVMEILEELDLKIPVISIAKREEEIFVPGRVSPIVLDKRGKALKLLQALRDEAHRFAINYNRLLRRKKIRDGN
jgi:excinuclease ABC subunit C